MRIIKIALTSTLAISTFASSAQAISFSTFVSGASLTSILGQDDTIGFTYAGDKFVGSVYFGANNNQLYSTDLNGGNLAKFGAPLPNLAGEIYVSSSLLVGGFGPRDVYAGAENRGEVWRISHDGSSTSLFASGLNGGVRSIAFDPYGLYGNNMIVATSSGRIYKIDSAGVPTLLASVGEDAEGLAFSPNAFGGKPAGTLFVASEGSGVLRSIAPDGTKSLVVSGLPGAEMVSFVPLNLGASGNPVEGFYAANYPFNVQKAAASDFLAYRGSAIVTGESGHQIWAVNPTTLAVTHLGFFPAQPEDGIFVTADVIRGHVPDTANSGGLLLGVSLFGMLVRRWKTRAV